MADTARDWGWDDPVAQHVRPLPTALRVEQTVAEAVETVRRAELGDKVAYLYALDGRRLAGVLSVRRLLTAPPERTVGELIAREVHSLRPEQTLAEALEQLHRLRLLALPIVDADGAPLGQIDVTLFAGESDAAEALEARTVFQLIGIHLDRGRQRSPLAAFGDRFPWLTANIVGGLLGAVVASRYESLLDAVVALALFIPVTLAVAESVSIQSMSLTIRGLHAPAAGWLRAAAWREFQVAALLGLASGAVVAAAVVLWRGDGLVAAAVGLSLTAAVVTACLIGLLLPAAIHALGRDPSVAAGPLVLTLTDIATLLFYLNLAGALLDGR